MDRKARAKLFQLINEHVTAELTRAAWAGAEPTAAKASVERRQQKAVEELRGFVESLSAPDDLAITRLRKEVHLLNRALARKNRKLKTQYRALHACRPSRAPVDKVIYRDPVSGHEALLHVTGIHTTHAGEVTLYVGA